MIREVPESAGYGWPGGSSTGTRPGLEVTDPATLQRIQALVLPPAWRDVWISADPLGHIQATGVDSRGRTLYRYHEHRYALRRRGRSRGKVSPRVSEAAGNETVHDQIMRNHRTRRGARARGEGT